MIALISKFDTNDVLMVIHGMEKYESSVSCRLQVGLKAHVDIFYFLLIYFSVYMFK